MICVFDAYGTLFDVNAAARVAAGQPGNEALADVWPTLARDWRLKQLQYTWLRAITDTHVDFWQVTQDGLDWALEASGLDDANLRQTLLDLYFELEAYAEAPTVLKTLKAAGHQTAILSNGSPDMLNGAVQSAGLGGDLDAILSVEDVGIYKPSPKTYDMVGAQFGCAKTDVLFVSSNGWDIAGSMHYGFHTAWVNRVGEPADRLMAQPQRVLTDLTEIPNIAHTL